MRTRWVVFIFGVLPLLIGGWAVSAVATAGAGERHSGRVAAVDAAHRTLMLEELGAGGKVQTVHVRLAPEAGIVRSERLPDDRITDPQHPFKDSPIPLSAVRPGDFVVVELGGRGTHEMASSVVVTFEPTSK